jgi:nucleoside-diphosphate-sugar epimerase
LIDLLEGDPSRLLDEVRPTHLLHLAWTVEPGVFWSSPANLDWVAASLRLLRAFGAAGGQRAAMAGTCAEYDWRRRRLVEDKTPLVPATLYGEAKAALWRLARAAGPELGVSIGWGRVFFPFGPREPPGRLVGEAIDRLRAGEAFACSDGRQVRPYIFVNDAAEALVALLDSSVEGAVNIATAEVISVRHIVGAIAELLGAEGLVRWGARPVRAGEPRALAADVARLAGEVGFKPRFTFRQGIVETIAERRAVGSAT